MHVRCYQVEDAPPEGNAIVDHVMGLVNDMMGATLAAAKDAGGLVLGAPRFGVDVYVYVVGLARSMPALFVNIYNGDGKTLDDLTAFCVYAAGVIFTVYASAIALNLALSTFASVKDYFAGYMIIPTMVMGQKLPGPIMTVRDLIQRECLDRIRAFKVKAWIVPLEGQSGAPSLKGATNSMATVISACMILSCAPAVHSLMKGGADKGAAEALAYTLGTALGVQYLVKLNA